MKKSPYFRCIVSALFITVVFLSCENAPAAKSSKLINTSTPAVADSIKNVDTLSVETNIFDPEEYNKRVLALAHDSITKRWPAQSPVPLKGAILPFQRIIAYYGNFYSRHMGILGSLPEEQLIHDLNAEVEKWRIADKTTPAIPAIHYIAITAQSKPGKGNTYRLRMPEKQILRAISLAKKMKGITFLDVQVGHSTVKNEVPTLEQYLISPDVHLGLDPEWSMKDGSIPGRKIGTMDASDINFAVDYLSALVKKHNLPPKILVVHRFTKGMITNSDKIKKTPEVQIVIDMDGFGFPAKKIDSYKRFVSGYPVQFTGFKLFYKNDIKSKPYRMMSPKEILHLYPKPIYIQYQ
jgi:hypothetical protein